MRTHVSARFQRTNIRLPGAHYLGRRLYFITLCFHTRRRFGTNSRIAEWLITRLKHQAAQWKFFIHAYCVMPDHVHILAAGASDESNAMVFVESFKQETAVAFSRRMRRRLWQGKYYDHILRQCDSMDRVAWYIWMNPVRKGMCRVPGDYALLGSFTEIGTKLLRSFRPLDWTPPWRKDVCRAEATALH